MREALQRVTLRKDEKGGEGADCAFRMRRVQVQAVMSFLEVSQALPSQPVPSPRAPTICEIPEVQPLPLLLQQGTALQSAHEAPRRMLITPCSASCRFGGKQGKKTEHKMKKVEDYCLCTNKTLFLSRMWICALWGAEHKIN